VRVLVLSPSLPLPFAATDARWLHVLLSELALLGHDVGCVSCTPDDPGQVEQAREAAEATGYRLAHVPLAIDEPVAARKLRSLLRPESHLARVPGLARALAAELQRQPEIFHVEHLNSLWAAPAGTNPVAYIHNLISVDWGARDDLTPRERVALWQGRRAEQRLLRQSQGLIAMTPRLRDELLQLKPGLNVSVAPMAIDATLYQPLASLPPVVGLIGSMRWQPSRSAAVRLLTRIWPAILEQAPDARLLVAGWHAHDVLREHLPVDAAELVDVVEHPRDFFSRIGVLVYPTPRGSGMKVKVLEAMAYGVPVVTNREGIEGIEAERTRDYLHAETDAEFVAAAASLLSDAHRRRAIGLAGRTLLETRHPPREAVIRLLQAHDELRS
jgi:glycosyltransferase involved in cell wall biosynthesis